MKLWDSLKRDHREVADLFKRLEETGDYRRQSEIFSNIRRALEFHTTLEEQHFYPVLHDYDHTRDLAQRALQEHRKVAALLDEITRLAPGAAQWTALAHELKSQVEAHVDEEEKLLLPLAEEVLDTATIDRIGRAIEREKQMVAAR